MRKIGILAIHGDVIEHANILKRLGLEMVEIREAKDFKGLDGLILPGGESTTILDLLETFALRKPLEAFMKSGKPILATCAGLILLAKLKLLDVEVERNAYGKQIDSFETKVKIPKLNKEIKVAFIRAPKIKKVGKNVEVWSEFENSPILVKQGNIWGMSFHPEITNEASLHKFIFRDAK